jgi:hypothetical protein
MTTIYGCAERASQCRLKPLVQWARKLQELVELPASAEPFWGIGRGRPSEGISTNENQASPGEKAAESRLQPGLAAPQSL